MGQLKGCRRFNLRISGKKKLVLKKYEIVRVTNHGLCHLQFLCNFSSSERPRDAEREKKREREREREREEIIRDTKTFKISL